MSAEQESERVSAPVIETRRPNIGVSMSNALLERRLVRRAKQITDRIEMSEKSQRVTQKIMNLEFTI